MSAYINVTIIGRRSQRRNGSDEVQIQVRVITPPDLETATWLLREAYPSAIATDVVINAAHGYQPVTAKSLAVTPMRRQV